MILAMFSGFSHFTDGIVQNISLLQLVASVKMQICIVKLVLATLNVISL